MAKPANFSLTNLAGPPASVTPTGGTPQSATINTAFAAPLQATVTDAGNNPLSGVTVTFTAPASGASGAFAGGVYTAVTNSQGVATSAVFTANGTTGGPYNVTASVAGVATPADFSLTNLTVAAESFTPTGGTPQRGTINTAFAAPLQATVTDDGITDLNPTSGPIGVVLVTISGRTLGRPKEGATLKDKPAVSKLQTHLRSRGARVADHRPSILRPVGEPTIPEEPISGCG